MTLLVDVLILVFSIAALVKGADYFVDSSSSIAKKFGISEFIIGLTLVSVGTSLPEMGAAVAASLAGNSKIVLGDIVGSNIANIALVLGVAVAFHTTDVKAKSSQRKFSVYLVIATFMFFIFSFLGAIGRTIGLLFMAFFVTIIYFIKDDKHFSEELRGKAYRKEDKKKIDMRVQSAVFLLSLIFIFGGANFLIPAVQSISSGFGVSELMVSLVVIAIGTSLPELAVSISAARKKKADLLLGNIIGSNLSNLLLIGGISAVISPIVIDSLSLFITIPIMLLLTLILSIFIRNRWEFKAWQGITALIVYVVFIGASFAFQNFFI
ncbi:calcium/sodium antiporter [Candidatus Woesearchaeota archaeon]|nr:calcium/sodium antiporter [Candidatus Woesearchaeota archaeon]